jgi:hypothetical protein
LLDDDDEVGVELLEITLTAVVPEDTEDTEFLLAYGSFTTLEEG